MKDFAVNMENNIGETPLFHPDILEKLKTDFKDISKVTFKSDISPANPGDSLLMRPLHLEDYDRGYLQLLSQLTTVGSVSRKLFEEQFNAYKACPDSYYIVVIEDTNTGHIVATGTLGIDFKFTHMCSKKGKLDEVVVKEEYRGKQLGKLLVETLTLLSQCVGCYKTTLECKTENIPFYNKFGYVKDDENYMSYRHEHCCLHKDGDAS